MTSPSAQATTYAIDTLRNDVPLTSRTTGRTIASLNTRSPIALITKRNVSHRATIRRGVAAVSEIDGITNCGAGPGFGPTANVNAPRTGCPSAEMIRHQTRYQPSASFFSGTTSVSAFAGDRPGEPAVCCSAAAFVTDTMAKRGSTASLYVRVSCFGEVLTVPLAEGVVRRSAACAQAAAGSARAATAANRAMPQRCLK